MVIKKEKVANERVCSLLSYLLIGIIWYFADEKMKKSSFAKFHAKQGIVFLIAAIIYGIIISIILWPLMIVSLDLLWPIYLLLRVIPWIFVIIGIINALNGKEKELPIIGKFAKNLSF